MLANLVLTWVLMFAAGPDDDRIGVVLQELEDRGKTVSDLTCRVEYTIEDRLAGDKYTKFGEIRYKKKAPNPVFFIHFDKIHQAGKVNRKQEWYVFDGRFLWEIKEAAKNRIQHEVVAEGETIDLFDIEQSPIPIPFGQKKDQILRNFDVTLAPPADGDPDNTDHLVCTPKPESTITNEVDRMEFFVSRSYHLPVKIVSIEKGGAQSNMAVFPDLGEQSINRNLDDAKLALPKEAADWPMVKAEPGQGISDD